MTDTKTVSADALIRRLQLAPHPEGGYFRRIHASIMQVQWNGRMRKASTAIEFLLVEGQRSQWHRVDADEIWLWRAGGALQLDVFDPQTGLLQSLLVDDHLASQDEMPNAASALQVVPAGCWQRAGTAAAWSLVSCVVTPGFEWDSFTLIGDAPDVAGQLSSLDAL